MVWTGGQQTRYAWCPQILTTKPCPTDMNHLYLRYVINSISEKLLKFRKELMGWLWNSRRRSVQMRYIIETACHLSRWVVLKACQQAPKTTPAKRGSSLVNLCWKQNKELWFMVQPSVFQPHFYQMSSTAHNHTATQILDWPNFQFLFQQGNWNNFHFYSIWTLHWYFQPSIVNALTEGLFILKSKLFSKTHKIQLPTIQRCPVRDCGFNRGCFTHRYFENGETKYTHCMT